MKKVLALFVFFLGATFLGFSQEKNNSDYLTSGKWKVESMVVDNEKLELSKEDNWMVFSRNGMYKIKLDKTEQLGTWKLLSCKTKIKFDSDNFEGKSIIKKLTDKEFLFSISEGDVVYTMKLKK